ncbi:hypothetical protein E4T39_06812 [Aureobasidium subglaciale]|nr:hypothetical protein E4T39_06812 [Aureobasidium subglaciale]
MQYRVNKSNKRKRVVVKVPKALFSESARQIRNAIGDACSLTSSSAARNLGATATSTILEYLTVGRNALESLEAGSESMPETDTGSIIKKLVSKVITRKIDALSTDETTREILDLDQADNDIQEIITTLVLDHVDAIFTKAVRSIIEEKIKERVNIALLELVRDSPEDKVEAVREQLQQGDEEDEYEDG